MDLKELKKVLKKDVKAIKAKDSSRLLHSIQNYEKGWVKACEHVIRLIEE